MWIKPRAGGRAQVGETVRQQRVEREREDRVADLLELLDDADAVDHGVGPRRATSADHRVEVARVHPAEQCAPATRARTAGSVVQAPRRSRNVADVSKRSLEHLEDLVAQHAVAAKDEYLHRSASSLAQVRGSRATQSMYSSRPSFDGHGRRVAERRPRRRDVGEAVAHVALRAAARTLRRPPRRGTACITRASSLIVIRVPLPMLNDPAHARRERRRDVGGGDVGDVDEVARLLAVAEDRQRPPLRMRSAKIGITLP